MLGKSVKWSALGGVQDGTLPFILMCLRT
jgi:hypothetical protein